MRSITFRYLILASHFLSTSVLIAQNTISCALNKDSMQYYLSSNIKEARNYISQFENIQMTEACKWYFEYNLLRYYISSQTFDSMHIQGGKLTTQKIRKTFPEIYQKSLLALTAYYINYSINDTALSILNLLQNEDLFLEDRIKLMINHSTFLTNNKQWGESLDMLLEAKSMYDSNDLKEPRLEIQFYDQLAINNINLLNYEKASYYLDTCIRLAHNEKINNKLSYYYMHKAFIYSNLSESDSCIANLNRAKLYLQYAPYLRSPIIQEEARYYSSIYKHDKAEKLLVESLDYFKEYNINYLNNALRAIMFNRVFQGKFDNEHYLKIIAECCSDSNDTNDSLALEEYRLLSLINKVDKNLANDFNKFIIKNGKYRDVRVREAINESTIKYETELKEVENARLIAEQASKEATISTQRKLLISGSISLFTFLLFSVGLYRQSARQKQLNHLLNDQKNKIQILNQELNHRVKNNLAFMTSLLEMQSRRADSLEARQALRESESRLKALSLVHEQLFRSDKNTEINLKNYLQEIIGHLEHIFTSPLKSIKIHSDLIDYHVDAEEAMRLGLIINELVTNSFKHAFEGIEHPEIDISTTINAQGKLILEYKDNGPIGHSDILTQDNSGSLGIRLIELLKIQLGEKYVFMS